MSERLQASVLLETPGALLSRSHLREHGLERRAVDAVFRALDVVVLPGYSRPFVRVEGYLELLRRSTSETTGCERESRDVAQQSCFEWPPPSTARHASLS